MDVQEIYANLTEVMRKVFSDTSIVAAPEMTAELVSGWDSLGHIRLIVAVERTFGVKFSSQDISSFENVGELVERLAEKLAQKKA